MNLLIKGIELSYDGKEVLRGCSFSFNKSGIYILTGENGCGKSTLLRVCSLLEKPDKGVVEYYTDGKLLQHDMSLRRKITLVLPRIGVFNNSVYENVVYGLRLRKVPKKEIERKAREALAFVQLSHKVRQNALTLSSGETQRLGIARAIILKPEVLFLDEPTASVDKKNISIIEDIIFNLKSSHRLIIMTTHDEQQAKRLGDTVLQMDEGVLI